MDGLKAILILIGFWLALALIFTFIIKIDTNTNWECVPDYMGSCN